MGEITHVIEKFKKYLGNISAYQEALMLIHWDMRTKIPQKGVEQRSEVAGLLGEKIHKLETSDEMKYYIDAVKESSTDPLLLKIAEVCEENYERNRKIPTEEYRLFIMAQTKSEAVWQEAREKADFRLFQPDLEKLMDFNRKFATYWGYEDNIYDALLHNFEPGVTTKMLDEVFPRLRKSLLNLLTKITNSSNQPNPALLQNHFPKKDQETFTKKILEQMGYDFQAGRLDETIHPFAIALNKNDVRITTRYDEQDFRMAVFGTIHEGGHGLYEQNIDDRLMRTPLATGTSMGIHESQSLFWENFIARSQSFWETNYDLFLQYAPKAFQQVDRDQFYHAINEVKPSFIRIEADELTYSLHIMIRYELEKSLINNDIQVKDLPALWNEKMKDYLGIVPPSDKEGVLQDIHWAGGDFGYFPSYALGYMYAAQIYQTMNQQLDIESIVKSADFTKIKQWLGTSIHQYGKVKNPLEIIHDVTKEPLNPDHLICYLQEKYATIYQF
ncbi:carboxypeptidase M32 [Virgibacillus salexigens]|uniref:Metal-dependent carboxypeptidase n=1 Tax=Virgibacillus massiliensis TaxID=1462526 RepID=A0A024QBC3_9BACI|nr:carboxypeptidase M32 [Virgibacillus massiliensis]CDQ39848.1 Putative metalloprotease YpwA [Virgibacillus massiliensis]